MLKVVPSMEPCSDIKLFSVYSELDLFISNADVCHQSLLIIRLIPIKLVRLRKLSSLFSHKLFSIISNQEYPCCVHSPDSQTPLVLQKKLDQDYLLDWVLQIPTPVVYRKHSDGQKKHCIQCHLVILTEEKVRLKHYVK